MDQTHAEEIVRTYLEHLVKSGLVENDALAVLFDACGEGLEGSDDPIEVIVVSERFDTDPLIKIRDLIVATWEVDTRIDPFPASFFEWENYLESPKLTRAKANGKIITVS